MRFAPRHGRWHLAVMITALVVSSGLAASSRDAAEDPIEQFLSRDDEQHAYRAARRLEAENGDRKGWIEALTEYAPATGFKYQVTAEGGSSYIRDRVLRVLLHGEGDAIATGGIARSALARSNYAFQPNGIDSSGLANVLLSPRRKEPLLLSGTMFLQPIDGALVRLQGRLAKTPSFWVKSVDIVRSYERIEGAVVPVGLESKVQLRFFGAATLRMTYIYSEINGRPVAE